MTRLYLAAAASLMPVMLAAQAPQAAEAPVTIVPAPATTLPLKHAPVPTSPEISAKDLMTRLYIFADDSHAGPRGGHASATEGRPSTSRAEAKRFGLIPAGDSGTYFQTLPFKTRTRRPGVDLSVGGNAARVRFRMGRDRRRRADQPERRGGLRRHAGRHDGHAHAGTGRRQARGLRLPGRTPGASAADARRRARRRWPIVGPDQLLGYFRRPATFVDDPSRSPPRLRPRRPRSF